MKALLSLLLLPLFCFAQSVPPGAVLQSWTATDGRVLQAKFVRVEADAVVVEKDGKSIVIPFSRLKVESVAQAKQLAAAQPAATSGTKPSFSGSVLKKPAVDFTKGFTNSLGMKFVPVPHTEVLFCIHETRIKDYAAYAAEVSGVKDNWRGATHRGDHSPLQPAPVLIWDQEDGPVVNVSFIEAQAFCEWLSKGEGLKYRLPTGLEWCQAAMVGDFVKKGKDGWIQRNPASLLKKENKFLYPWGVKWPPPKGAGNYADTSYAAKFPDMGSIPGYTDGFVTTAPVMSFQPNRLGIYDLGGNVMEWTDEYAGPPLDLNGEVKIIRGSCFWTADVMGMETLHSQGFPAKLWSDTTGFRVVVEAVKR